METNELIDALGENNILAVPYRKAPNGVNNFALGVAHNPEVFRIWTGRTTEVVVRGGDPDRKQAIINVAEGKRSITRTVRSSGYAVTNVANASFIRSFPITMPPGTRFTVTNKRTVTNSGGWHEFAADVTARAPRTQQTLLVGMDEVAYFVAALPKHATTIEGAHRALRPAGLSKEAKRQGEWFFTPATAAELAAINTHIATGKARIRHQPMEQRALQPSSHEATLLSVPGLGRFATGTVTDRRTGHHAPLELDGWHAVTRNAEVIVERTRQTRRWD